MLLQYRRRARAPISSPGVGGRFRSLAFATVLAASAGAIGAPAGVAAATPPGSCPDVRPASELVTNSTGRGWTVVQGHTPEPFGVEFLGVLDDGVGPGRDLIIIQVSDLPGSDFISKAHGIWAGISGSPVYQGGELVGSVSYSLNIGEAFIGGVTPAEDILKVLDYGPTTATEALGANHITVPAAMRGFLARRAGVSEQAAASFDRLAIPLAVSGLSKRGRDRLQHDYDRQGIPVIVTVGSSAATPTTGGTFETPHPGGNFAALLSYGDFTSGGIGTTTYVCGDQALAFGHPLTFGGKVNLGANGGEAIAIVPGLTDAFKLANIGAPLGLLDQDRMSAVRAHLGIAPSTIPITSRVTALESGNVRDGETDITDSSNVPGMTPYALIVNMDATLDRVGQGTAGLRWTIKGKDSHGDPFTVERGDKYASQGDITFSVLDDLYFDLSWILGNRYEDITFDSVDIRARVSDVFSPLTIEGAKFSKNGGPFQVRDHLRAHVGDTITVRTKVRSYRGDAHNVDQSLVVPAEAIGDTQLVVGPIFDDFFGSSPGGADFTEFLANIEAQTRNDDLRVRIVTFDFNTGNQVDVISTKTRLDSVLTGGVAIPLTVQP